MGDHETAERILMESIPDDWDKRPVLLALEMRNLISCMKDEGTEIDSGTDGERADLWITVQGVEYYISIGKSKSQLMKEGKNQND